MNRFLIGLLLLLCAPSTPAHVFEITEADVRFDGSRYAIDVQVDIDALALGVSPATVSAEVAAAIEPWSAEERAAALERVRSTLQRRIRLRFDDEKERPEISFPAGGASFAEELGIPSVFGVIARLEGEVPENAERFRFGLSRAFGPVRLTLGSVGSLESETILLGPAEDSPELSLDDWTLQDSLGSLMLRYVRLGFLHIVPMGLDHILFVLGLFLLCQGWRPLVIQISLFTLAHTVTLGISAAGIWSLPGSIVEPLIAASICWIAVENIIGARFGWRRGALVFGFGLLHGLGFAGVLGELGIPQDAFLPALASFNVGVEIGQLAVVAAAALLTHRFRQREWFRSRVVVPVSLLIALVGAYWAIERVLG